MEHACIGLLPLFAQCDRADIGGLSQDMHPGTGMATIFVYDGVPGGTGYLKELMRDPVNLLKVFDEARKVLENCECRKDPEKVRAFVANARAAAAGL